MQPQHPQPQFQFQQQPLLQGPQAQSTPQQLQSQFFPAQQPTNLTSAANTSTLNPNQSFFAQNQIQQPFNNFSNTNVTQFNNLSNTSTASQQVKQRPNSNDSFVINRTTRYRELSKEQQQFLDQLDKDFQSHIQVSESNTVALQKNLELLEQLPNDVNECQFRLSRVMIALSSDQTNLQYLRQQAENDANNFRLASNFVDIMKTPGSTLPRQVRDPVLAFIHETIENAEETMTAYAENAQNLSNYLHELNDPRSTKSDYQSLVTILKETQEEFLILSNKVAQIHDEMKRFKDIQMSQSINANSEEYGKM